MSAHMDAERPESHAGHWFVWLFGVMLVASLAAAIFLSFLSENPVTRYRVTLLLLFFAISSASSLIFSTSTRAKLEGNFRGLALSIGGPATLWIVALTLFSYFDREDGIRTGGLEEIARAYREKLSKERWQLYPQWRQEHDRFGKILGAGESATVRNLLWYAHFNPAGEKLESAIVSTAFVYLSRRTTLKLQRITGEFNGQKLSLHFAGRPSTEEGKVYSMLLSAAELESSKIDASHTSLDFPGKEAAELDSRKVDALILALYEGDDPGEGDYAVIDLKRYSQNAQGVIHLGIISFDRGIQELAVSHLRPVQVLDAGMLPLVLRTEGTTNSDAERLKFELGPWLRALDRNRTAPSSGLSSRAGFILAKAADHLKESIKCKAGSCFQAVFNQPKDARSISIAGADNAALAMYRWK